MHVVAVVDELRRGLEYEGRGAIVSPVERRSAGHDDHQAGSGVAVPAECPAGYDRVLKDIEVRGSLRVDPGLPIAGPCEDVELAEGAISNSHRRHARRGRCVGRHGCQHADAERQCDEKRQNWYFFELSQWVHCSSFLSFLRRLAGFVNCEVVIFCFVFVFAFHRYKRKRPIKVII